MITYDFKSSDVKRALAISRIVKTEDDDIRIKFLGNSLILASSDKRKRSIGIAPSQSSTVDSDFVSEEFSVSREKRQLLEPDSDTISISINNDSLKISTKGGPNTRRATLRKRVDRKSQWTRIKSNLSFNKTVPAILLDKVLDYVSCSALIKETKSEDDMRVNQVHFYPDESCVLAHARFYASIVIVDEVPDLSIVSSDIPLVRAFCSKFRGEDISIAEDKNKLYLRNDSNYLFLSKVPTTRPKLSIPKDDYEHVIKIEVDEIHKSLNWVDVAIEGTQRVTLSVESDNPSEGIMRFIHNADELSSVPVLLEKGKSFKADFPARVLGNVTRRLDDKIVTFKFKNKDSPSLLEISQEKKNMKVIHILQKMKDRE
jgi:hypothetical protein